MGVSAYHFLYISLNSGYKKIAHPYLMLGLIVLMINLTLRAPHRKLAATDQHEVCWFKK